MADCLESRWWRILSALLSNILLTGYVPWCQLLWWLLWDAKNLHITVVCGQLVLLFGCRALITISKVWKLIRRTSCLLQKHGSSCLLDGWLFSLNNWSAFLQIFQGQSHLRSCHLNCLHIDYESIKCITWPWLILLLAVWATSDSCSLGYLTLLLLGLNTRWGFVTFIVNWSFLIGLLSCIRCEC